MTTSSYFIKINELNRMISDEKRRLSLQKLIHLKIIPIYDYKDEIYILKNDIPKSILTAKSTKELQLQLPVSTLINDFLDFEDILIIINKGKFKNLAIYPGIKNILTSLKLQDSPRPDKIFSITFFEAINIFSNRSDLREFILEQQNRNRMIESLQHSQFANSASYMGSKKSLRGFIIESIHEFIDSKTILVDLMSGSGTVSGSFSQLCKTYASDAQSFSQKLALIHGSGFSLEEGEVVKEKVVTNANQNFTALEKWYSNQLEVEHRLFHSAISQSLIEEYIAFMKNLPTYPSGGKLNNMDTISEVNIRKNNHNTFPYCLFSTYFTNTFFGLRQSLEIDSIRYAIDQLTDKKQRDWAMGALISTISALSTSFGGHFAQPKYSNYDQINLRNIYRFLEKRSQSILHEFIVRFSMLLSESMKSKHRVNILEGPWEKAIDELRKKEKGKDILIYLDAPYKREEYSRYYHVLETLVKYNYPTVVGKGKTPNKKTGERFRSEFFDRNKNNVSNLLIKIISTIVDNGWKCAWSYSDNGLANIYEVIEKVVNRCDCTVTSYCAPYDHRSHGGKKPKRVNEYVIVFH